MSAEMLHQGATVQCLHGGQAQPTVASQRVKVGNQPIVVQSTQYTIAGCSLPPQSGGPCTTASWTSGATRVKAGGVPVLLKDSQAICAPPGTGVNVLSTQTRVKAT